MTTAIPGPGHGATASLRSSLFFWTALLAAVGGQCGVNDWSSAASSALLAGYSTWSAATASLGPPSRAGCPCAGGCPAALVMPCPSPSVKQQPCGPPLSGLSLSHYARLNLSGPPNLAIALGSARPGASSCSSTSVAPGCASESLERDRTLHPTRHRRGRGHAQRRRRLDPVPAGIGVDLSTSAPPCAMAAAPCTHERRHSRGRRGVLHALRRAKWCSLGSDALDCFTPRRPRWRR